MASGFGYSHSSGYITAGYGRIYASANVTQSINAANRTVTISVRALLTYYRASGGSWNPGTSTLFENNISSNYIRATLDGSSASDGPHLGLRGANTTLTVGNYYDLYLGGVSAYDVAQVTKSTTFNYNTAGDAITKSWAVNIQYDGTSLSLSGSVTTDPISATGDPPSDGYANDLSSEYIGGYPFIVSSSAGVNDGGLSLTTLQFFVSSLPYSSTVPAQYINFTNSSAVSIGTNNSLSANGGVTLEFNKPYYASIYAVNSKGNYQYAGPRVFTVPAPAFYSLLNANADNVEISYTTTADGGALPVIIQYSTDGGVNWQDGPTIAHSDTVKQGRFTIGDLDPATTYTIKLRTSTSAGYSETGSITVTTKTVKLYGSVNGSSEEIVKLYGSVGGESKAIKKLYGSVNGRAKLIYKEN